MAFSLGKVTVTVGADTMRFQRGMRSAIGQMIFFSRAADKMGTQMSRGAKAARLFSIGFQALGHAVTIGIVALTAATAAVASFSIKAIDKFIELDTALVEVAAIAGATELEFKQLKKQTYELSEAVGQGADELAKGQKFLAMAGFGVQETMGALPEVAKIATIGMMELGDASDIVTNIMTGFGKTVADLPDVVETLTNTMTSSNTNMRQLGDAMKYIGPLARAAGQDINETVAAVGLLGNAGLQGEMGGTALRNVLTRLLNPVGKAKKALDAMNIQVKNADGSIKSLADIMEQFEKTGLGASTAMKIFAQRAGPGFLALLNQGSDALRELTQANKESAKAQEIYNKILESTEYQLRQAKVAAENYMRTIGESLSEALVVGIKMIREWEGEFVDAHTSVRLATEDLIIAVLDFSLDAIKAWDKWNDAIEVVRTVLSTIWDTLQMGALLVIGTISTLAQMFYELVTAVDTANVAATRAWSKLRGDNAKEQQEAVATALWLQAENQKKLAAATYTSKRAFNELSKSAASFDDNISNLDSRINADSEKMVKGYKALLELKLRIQKKQGENAFSIDPYADTGGQSMLPPDMGQNFAKDLDLSGVGKAKKHTYDWLQLLKKVEPIWAASLEHSKRIAEIQKADNLTNKQKEMAIEHSRLEMLRVVEAEKKKAHDESLRRSKERISQWRTEHDEYLDNMRKVIESIARTRQLLNEQTQWQRDEAYSAGGMMSGQLTSGVFDEDLESKNREAEMEYLRSVNDQKAIQNKLAQEHNDHIREQIAAYKTLGSQISESAKAIDGLAQAYSNAEPGLERQIAKQKMIMGIMHQVPGLADAVFGAMGMSAENAAISQAILNTALAATALGMGNIGSAIAFAGGAIGAIGSLLAKNSAKKTYQRPTTTAAKNNADADRKGDIVEALKEAGLFQPDIGNRTMNFFGNDPVAFQDRDTVAERRTRKHQLNAERNRF